MSRFTYKVSETSEDTRNYKIESDHHLTHDEILDLVGSCDTHPMADPYTDDGATITFVDTDFGDDSQLEIKADCSCDPINEYLCFDHEREAIKEKYPNAVYTDQCTWEVEGKEVEL